MDLTYAAVERQIGAMGCKLFEIGIRSEKGMPRSVMMPKGSLLRKKHSAECSMLRREWDPDSLLKSVGYLKAMNARGADIYIQAADGTPIVLIDDLSESAIADLSAHGLPASVVVETSSANFQAWVRFEDHLSPDELLAVSRTLAHLVGGDSGSVGSRHFGRLAGFTNRKPKHARNGRFPFCLCRKAQVELVAAGHDLVVKARADCAPIAPRPDVLRHDDAGLAFDAYFGEWLAHQHGKPDISAGDWGAASRLAREGWSAEAIEQAILEHSPGIVSRKGKHAADYARRTARKACGFKA